MSNNSGGGIPKTIKIGETELVISENQELIGLVESVRKEEKSKLYSTISALQTENKTLKESSKSGEDLAKTYEDKIAKLESELANTKKEKNKENMAEDTKPEVTRQTGLTAEQVSKIVEDALKKQSEEYEGKITELSGKLNSKSVSDYRKEQLAKYKGSVISELIPENLSSTEEVDKAVEKALETSKDYIRKEYKDAKGKVQNLTLREIEELEKQPKEESKPEKTPTYEGGNQSGVPTPPPNTGGGVDGKSLIKDLDKMSNEEFEKNREAIRQEIRKVGYGSEDK